MKIARQISITGKKYKCKTNKLNAGDLATSTIDPKTRLSALIGKKTDTTAEYLSSASEISRTDSVVSR